MMRGVAEAQKRIIVLLKAEIEELRGR